MGALPLLVDVLRAEGAWLGASWLAWLQEDGFVFGGRYKDGRLVISAIGGKVEPGESFLAAARREFTEETGAPPPAVVPRQCGSWLLADGAGASSRPKGDAEGAWTMIRKVPDGVQAPPTLWIAVFLGVTYSQPTPVEKLEAFPVFTPEEFAALAKGDLESGEVRLAGGQRLPRGIAISLKDTPRALAECPEFVQQAFEAIRAREREGRPS